MPVARVALLALICFALVPACGVQQQRTADLQAHGIRTFVTGHWYRFEAEEGYRFQMPGIPRAEREQFVFAGVPVEGLFFDLRAEGNSRGYQLRVVHAPDLDELQRETLRVELERMIVDAGEEASPPEPVPHLPISAFQRTVTNITANGHFALVRSLTHGEYVFSLVAIMAPAAGGPSDAQRFFESLELPAAS